MRKRCYVCVCVYLHPPLLRLTSLSSSRLLLAPLLIFGSFEDDVLRSTSMLFEDSGLREPLIWSCVRSITSWLAVGGIFSGSDRARDCDAPDESRFWLPPCP